VKDALRERHRPARQSIRIMSLPETEYTHKWKTAKGWAVKERRFGGSLAQAQDGSVRAKSIPTVHATGKLLIERLVVVYGEEV
jgi:hypothetical protein